MLHVDFLVSPASTMQPTCVTMLLTCVLALWLPGNTGHVYVLDDSQGLGRRFDGIGGLSGGGATSKLLVNYPEPQRGQILDLLFKPNFAASLHILKVEIGGDDQTTDGTESSHMHEPWDENYDRGYEWWLMKEAKQRNPDIKLVGLPWSFPGWLQTGDRHDPYGNPELTADYITRWIKGAKREHDLDIDYIGIWNERSYDIKYIKILRQTLDDRNLQNIKIIAPDGGWGIAKDMLADPELNNAVDIIGVHYPGVNTTIEALKTGKTLWSSEDYSTYNDNVGAGCWARILNQNYVSGFMTSTISWNLIASYYMALPFGRDGLMTAMEPWSGHYTVESPMWITAHTTQFVDVGWSYLRHGYGVGYLANGGSYVTLTCPMRKMFTIILETASHNHSLCIRPGLPVYKVTPQNVTLQLKGAMANLTQLHVWYSKLGFDGAATTLFKEMPPLPVINGAIELQLGVDEIYTLSSRNGNKGEYSDIPPSAPFPLPYKDNFESYPIGQEAYNFAPQVGVYEVHATSDQQHLKVNRQVLLHKPIYWCDNNVSINIGGNYNWSDVKFQIDFNVPTVNGSQGVFVATRVDRGGCDSHSAQGVFCFLDVVHQSYTITADLAQTTVITSGPVKLNKATWYTLSIATQGSKGSCMLNSKPLEQFDLPSKTSTHGFVGFGTTQFQLADFDNLHIEQSKEIIKTLGKSKENILKYIPYIVL